MPLAGLDARQDGVPTVDLATIDRFLASPPDIATLLLFRGDPARPEAGDIAVVLPQLIAAFPGKLRPAVVAPDAERALMPRFDVKVTPSLAVVDAGRPLGVIAKIQDWSVYVARIGQLLAIASAQRQGAA